MRSPSMLLDNSAIKRPLDRLQSADVISAVRPDSTKCGSAASASPANCLPSSSTLGSRSVCCRHRSLRRHGPELSSWEWAFGPWGLTPARIRRDPGRPSWLELTPERWSCNVQSAEPLRCKWNRGPHKMRQTPANCKTTCAATGIIAHDISSDGQGDKTVNNAIARFDTFKLCTSSYCNF